MKLLTTILCILVVTIIGCNKQEPAKQDNRTLMGLDSSASDKHVTMVQRNEQARPDESVSDIRELPTIMQYDIDAAQKVPSKEIVYVKPGEAARPTERGK